MKSFCVAMLIVFGACSVAEAGPLKRALGRGKDVGGKVARGAACLGGVCR